MSYEGITEVLCAKGHYQTYGCYQTYGPCGLHGCSELLVWAHDVDHTNGYNPEDPRTMPAPKVEIGWDDIPMVDHYGNKYFLKNLRFAPPPEGSRWRKVPTDAEIAAWDAEYKQQQAVFEEPADKYRIFNPTNLLFATTDAKEAEDYYWNLDFEALTELRMFNPRTL